MWFTVCRFKCSFVSKSLPHLVHLIGTGLGRVVSGRESLNRVCVDLCSGAELGAVVGLLLMFMMGAAVVSLCSISARVSSTFPILFFYVGTWSGVLAAT